MTVTLRIYDYLDNLYYIIECVSLRHAVREATAWRAKGGYQLISHTVTK